MQEINVSANDEATIKKFFELLSATNASGTANGKAEDYKLTFDDVKELHNIYCKLETEIKKSDKQTGAVYINEIESYLIAALKYEARNISDKRTLEYSVYKAKLEAKAEEETPGYFRPWYRLFRSTPNRAQELVNEEAELNADYLHNIKEADLNRLEKELEQIEVGYAAGEHLSLKKKIKLRRKIAGHKRALRRLKKRLQAAEPGEPADILSATEAQTQTPATPANIKSVTPRDVAAAPFPTTAPPLSDTKPAKKPKKKSTTPVVVIEQLPGQIDIEHVNTTK